MRKVCEPLTPPPTNELKWPWRYMSEEEQVVDAAENV